MTMRCVLCFPVTALGRCPEAAVFGWFKIETECADLWCRSARVSDAPRRMTRRAERKQKGDY